MGIRRVRFGGGAFCARIAVRDFRIGSRATDLRCPRDVRFYRERTFRYVGGDPPRLVFGQQLRR
jgi:hypothetical protein